MRLLFGHETRHLGGDLRHRTNVRQGVQWNRDVEVIFKLADQLQHLKRIEAEIGQKLAPWFGVDRTPAQTLQDFDSLAFEPIGGTRGRARRGSPAHRVWCVAQAMECNMKATLCARRGSIMKVPPMNQLSPVTQTVILAAGSGSRLAHDSAGVPKPLMNVGGVPLLARALAHARGSGCLEAVIVVGHERAQVMAAARSMSSGLELRFVETPDPSAPNGVSLLAAQPLTKPQFFLQMVDHLLERLPCRCWCACPSGPTGDACS